MQCNCFCWKVIWWMPKIHYVLFSVAMSVCERRMVDVCKSVTCNSNLISCIIVDKENICSGSNIGQMPDSHWASKLFKLFFWRWHLTGVLPQYCWMHTLAISSTGLPVAVKVLNWCLNLFTLFYSCPSGLMLILSRTWMTCLRMLSVWNLMMLAWTETSMKSFRMRLGQVTLRKIDSLSKSYTY